MHPYWTEFELLIKTPFAHVALIWGIVPLYFGWLLNELTSAKASYRTAVQTGFCFLWAAAQWVYPYFVKGGFPAPRPELKTMPPVNLAVTSLVLVLGVAALVSGLRQRFPKHGRFLGHTRFANYFMITIYPMQAPHCLAWSWLRLETIALFAVPVWLAFDLGLMPLRKLR
jgi:hypothetical protein